MTKITFRSLAPGMKAVEMDGREIATIIHVRGGFQRWMIEADYALAAELPEFSLNLASVKRDIANAIEAHAGRSVWHIS